MVKVIMLAKLDGRRRNHQCMEQIDGTLNVTEMYLQQLHNEITDSAFIHTITRN